MPEAPKEKKTRVRNLAPTTITEQAKKLSLPELVAHYNAVQAEIKQRQADLAKQLELANSI